MDLSWAMPATYGYDVDGYRMITGWSDAQIYAYLSGMCGHGPSVRQMLAWYETTGAFTPAQRHFLDNSIYRGFFES